VRVVLRQAEPVDVGVEHHHKYLGVEGDQEMVVNYLEVGRFWQTVLKHPNLVLGPPPPPILTYIEYLLVAGHDKNDCQGCHDSVTEVIDTEEEAHESNTHEKNELGKHIKIVVDP
jgi:hypothetical protein